MNYITLILVVAMAFGLSDFLTERVPALQRLMYVLGFATIYVLFTIKYYYGTDILHYYNHYTMIESVGDVWRNPEKYSFEIGYSLFVAILKGWGVSLYWVTAIISTVYFVAIALLFKQIKRKRCFAMMLLVLLDYNLLIAEYRQCLAVSFFILMVLCVRDRKWAGAIVFAILMSVMHKSGVFVLGLYVLCYALHGTEVRPLVFQVLMLVLGLMLVFPISKMLSAVLGGLSGIGPIASLLHHLQLGRQVQMIWIVYAMLIVCVEYYLHFQKTRWSSIAIAAVVGVVVVVSFYQYYYLLNRVRSFFVPLLIVWSFRIVQDAEDAHKMIPYGLLLKQVICLSLFVFSIHSTRMFTKNSKKLHAPVCEACTLLDLRGHVDPHDVQMRQLEKSRMFWKYDFMKHDQNSL